MSVAAAVRSRVDRSPVGTFFVTSDFEGSARAVESALSRMVREEGSSLRRVRKGLYWKGVRSRFGPGRPDPAAIARAVAKSTGRSFGPAGWNASHALELSTQVPATPEFAIFGPAPTGVKGAVFKSRWNPARSGLGFWDVALLEVLADWPSRSEVGWADLVEISRGLLKKEKLHPRRLEKAVEGESSPAVRKNFGKLWNDLDLLPAAA